MSNLTATFRGRAEVVVPATATIYNVSVPLANTEVSQSLNSGTKKFTIRVRGSSTLKLAFTALDSGSLYLTVPRGASYSEEGVNFTGSLYFQTDQPSQTVEIVEWT